MTHSIYPEPAKPSQKMYFWGAILAVALIGALLIWAAELITRDMDGVPVIQASNMPMRTEPKDRNAPTPKYSELTINDVINPAEQNAQDNEVAIVTDPVEVESDDLVALDISLETQAQLDLLTAGGEGGENRQGPLQEAFETDLEFEDGSSMGLALAPDPNGAPEVTLSQDVSDGVAAALEEVLAVDAARNGAPNDGEIIVSLRAPVSTLEPKMRPASTDALTTSNFTNTAPSVARIGQEIPARDVPDDAYVVQLVALNSAEAARTKWDEIVSRNPSYFDRKLRVISQTVRNGNTLYRLRVAGFSGPSDANAFCAVLEQTGQECLVTQMR